jgi:8-oxo-dGTP pyrophosphatase MutT (NUDIX family)
MYSTNADRAGIRVKAGVGILIADSAGRLLLERRSDNGLWGLPGGGIEPGESVTDAAIRETKEETGLDVRIVRFIGVYSKPQDGRIVTYPDNGDIAHLVDVIFEGHVVSGRLEPSVESLELKFFHACDLPLDIVPPAVRPIQDYFSGKSGHIC